MPNVEEKDFHPRRNDDEWRRQVEEILKTGNAKFHFQKTDGSLRDMFCTLQSSVLPDTYNSEMKSNARPGILVVWDIENDGWRSIRYESVIGFKFLGHLERDMEHESTVRVEGGN